MAETYRGESGSVSSKGRTSQVMGARNGRGINRPHSGVVTDITVEGANGANG